MGGLSSRPVIHGLLSKPSREMLSKKEASPCPGHAIPALKARASVSKDFPVVFEGFGGVLCKGAPALGLVPTEEDLMENL